MIDEKTCKVSEMDNDTLHLINNKLKEIMIKLKQSLIKILAQQIYCVLIKWQYKKNNCVTRLWWEYLKQKQHDNIL